jgi:hypothetical protein
MNVVRINSLHEQFRKSLLMWILAFQDITSLIGMSSSYCTVEPYVDAKFDLHVQKIGSNYKALMLVQNVI